MAGVGPAGGLAGERLVVPTAGSASQAFESVVPGSVDMQETEASPGW